MVGGDEGLEFSPLVALIGTIVEEDFRGAGVEFATFVVGFGFELELLCYYEMQVRKKEPGSNWRIVRTIRSRGEFRLI